MALLDQADPEVSAALAGHGLGAEALRSAVLDLLGVSNDLPRLALPPLVAAGTMDRPALAVEELDPRAWRLLAWRQAHLPLPRMHRIDDWHALSSLERRAALRVANELRLDDDQRYSLHARHSEAVEALAHAAHPEFVETLEQLRARSPGTHAIRRQDRSRWERHAPNVVIGWPTWFANRRVGVRDRRFDLLTRASYRGQPAPGR